MTVHGKPLMIWWTRRRVLWYAQRNVITSSNIPQDLGQVVLGASPEYQRADPLGPYSKLISGEAYKTLDPIKVRVVLIFSMIFSFLFCSSNWLLIIISFSTNRKGKRLVCPSNWLLIICQLIERTRNPLCFHSSADHQLSTNGRMEKKNQDR